MALQSNITEYYQEHRSEIEVIADEKALFTLLFIEQHGSITVQQLSQHLGLEAEEVDKLITMLGDAKLLRFAFRVQNGSKPLMTVKVSAKGLKLLTRLFEAKHLPNLIDGSDKATQPFSRTA